ncbi:MAG: hypothetical protein IPO88_09530 [Nannocystis sp.]|uniref:hypothetical protein n=1 Tax=Nannocystis sp. TaxID=1962667 RepID=UPI00242891E4|nr:hypothetical protein [Nannocystis sp.]MBK9753728.1 hypothetical protein [Nannocystis sp.]
MQVVAGGPALAEHAIEQWGAGVELGAAEVEREVRRGGHEVEVLLERGHGGVGVEDQHVEAAEHVELAQDLDRGVVLARGEATLQGHQALVGVGLDADVGAQRVQAVAHDPEHLEVGVVGPGLDDDAEAADRARLEGVGEGVEALEVLLLAGDEEVVVVEDEDLDAAVALEGDHLVGDILGGRTR